MHGVIFCDSFLHNSDNFCLCNEDSKKKKQQHTLRHMHRFDDFSQQTFFFRRWSYAYSPREREHVQRTKPIRPLDGFFSPPLLFRIVRISDQREKYEQNLKFTPTDFSSLFVHFWNEWVCVLDGPRCIIWKPQLFEDYIFFSSLQRNINPSAYTQYIKSLVLLRIYS